MIGYGKQSISEADIAAVVKYGKITGFTIPRHGFDFQFEAGRQYGRTVDDGLRVQPRKEYVFHRHC